MNAKVFALIATAALGLSACQQQVETSVAPERTASAASDAATTVQTLDSSDGKIRILIQGGRFADTDDDARPDGISAEELTLLQRDDTQDITLQVASLGNAVGNTQSYFANLKSDLNNSGLSEVQVGAATDNRMNYRFIQTDAAGSNLRENCIAIADNNALYSVCASSPDATQEQLAAVLKDVNLIK